VYRAADDTLVLSPSDLTAFLACGHLTQLEQLVARGVRERPERHDPELDVLRRRGDEHEHRELARLRALDLHVVEITSRGPSPDELRAAEAETVAAMRAGADVVFQATFFDGRWRGHADFLLKVPGHTALGPWGYEVADTKLARRAKPEALLQLCNYAEHVARIQGEWPAEVEVVTGLGERSRHRVADIAAYYAVAKARLEAVVDGPPLATYPDPVAHCAVCPWAAECEARRRADDHLSLVAGMRPDMVLKLAEIGVTTASQLAVTEVGDPVPRMGQPTADRLRQQARLQLLQRGDGRIHHELLEPDGEIRGLAGLPAPSPGDVFFDLEGDPFAGDTGLEYLWGAWTSDGYIRWWAHTPAAEQAALEGFVDWVLARLTADPDLHVYHYAPYERSVLTRLSARYGTREAEVDRLLRGDVLVDLYRVVRQGIRLSTEGYGLKKLEPLWLAPEDRAGEVADGGSSIVAYEAWLDTGDQSLLDAIEAYNEVDCRSTGGLRHWLEDRRLELEFQLGEALARPEAPDSLPSESVVEEDEAIAALSERLLAAGPPAGTERDARELLVGLLGWHRREAKPEWWAWFDRLERSDADLVNDHESIGELEYVAEVGEVGRSVVHRYSFDPAQEHKAQSGSELVDPRTEKAYAVVAVDPLHGTIDLKRGKGNDAPHPRSLIPAPPFGDKVLREAVAEVARWIADNGFEGGWPHRAVRDLLLGRPPRVWGREHGAELALPGEHASDAARRLAIELDGGCLAVQGPPGSGKTYTGAALIIDLVKAGHRVGITASSHKAIGNLLDAVCRRAADEGVEPRIMQKASEDQRCSAELVQCASNAEIESALASGDVDVVAGTSWLFARPALAGTLRTLVVDEAGQLSLANVLAVSRAADDLVLLGDPQQLAQPSKGTHPPGVGLSALEHVLEGHPTVPPDRGLFLETSYRMHPDVCRFVSELAYESRLEPDPACGKQGVAAGPLVGGAGLRWLPVAHEGNRTRSAEEAEAVAAVVQALLDEPRPWTDVDGQQAWLTLDDILVIAPFNAQVASLAAVLPEGARVGTVDRFQGQEAPVVVYSLAASSADDVPRGVSFLYSRNRLNVAVSRARALAVVVASPALLTARVRTPAQLALVNGLCRYVELAEEVIA
jgi:predicted RecB family nuclease